MADSGEAFETLLPQRVKIADQSVLTIKAQIRLGFEGLG